MNDACVWIWKQRVQFKGSKKVNTQCTKLGIIFQEPQTNCEMLAVSLTLYYQLYQLIHVYEWQEGHM
jgi:hypothetical protein